MCPSKLTDGQRKWHLYQAPCNITALALLCSCYYMSHCLWMLVCMCVFIKVTLSWLLGAAGTVRSARMLCQRPWRGAWSRSPAPTANTCQITLHIQRVTSEMSSDLSCSNLACACIWVWVLVIYVFWKVVSVWGWLFWYTTQNNSK